MNNLYFRPFQRNINPEDLLSLINTESADVLEIDFLSLLAKRREERRIWSQILELRKEEYEILKRLYTKLTSSKPKVNQEIFQPPGSYQEGVESQLQRHKNRQQKLLKLKNEAEDPNTLEIINNLIGMIEYEENLLEQIGTN